MGQLYVIGYTLGTFGTEARQAYVPGGLDYSVPGLRSHNGNENKSCATPDAEMLL